MRTEGVTDVIIRGNPNERHSLWAEDAEGNRIGEVIELNIRWEHDDGGPLHDVVILARDVKLGMDLPKPICSCELNEDE